MSAMLQGGPNVQAMLEAEVLKPLPQLRSYSNGVVLVCDTETNPGQVIVSHAGEHRFISLEPGILLASPSSVYHGIQGLDPSALLIEPIQRARRSHVLYTVLCVNISAITEPFLAMDAVEMVFHLVEAQRWMTNVHHIRNVHTLVHLPSADQASAVNFAVHPKQWDQFTHPLKKRLVSRLSARQGSGFHTERPRI